MTRRRPKAGEAFSVGDRVEGNHGGNGEFYPGQVRLFLFCMSQTPKDIVIRYVCCVPSDFRRQRGRHVQYCIRRRCLWNESQVNATTLGRQWITTPRHAISHNIGQTSRVTPWLNSWSQLFISATIWSFNTYVYMFAECNTFALRAIMW